MSHRRSISILLSTTLISIAVSNASAADRILFDFKNQATRGAWSEVNDGVMGGISVGRHSFNEFGNLQFFGSLSLANNGGFASVRSVGTPLNLRTGDQLALRVRGDGRKYYLDVRSPSRRVAFSHRVSLQTQVGQWQEFRVPLTMFVGNSFGRVLPNSRPIPGRLNSIGFTISDKRPGPFNLEVDWIKVYRAE